MQIVLVRCPFSHKLHDVQYKIIKKQSSNTQKDKTEFILFILTTVQLANAAITSFFSVVM